MGASTFGTPGEPVHILESYGGHYEHHLFNSIDRNPTLMTVWMLNRIINGTKELSSRQQLIDKLKNCSTHQASLRVKQSALDFYVFQTEQFD